MTCARRAANRAHTVSREVAGTDKIAAALGLDAGDIGFDGFNPACWSAGVPLSFVPIRGLQQIGRCQPNLAYWGAAFGEGGRSAAYVFCRETVERGSAFHARMFAPRLGIIKDPATGAAVAAFAGVLAHFPRPRLAGDPPGRAIARG